MRFSFAFTTVTSAAVFALATPALDAQTRANVRQVSAPTALDSARYMRAPDWARGLRWRLVGPFRGGRAVAVIGDPTRRNVFYFGGVNGGVWKTTSAGNAWTNITDGKSTISSVGAIAIAPSDPNVLYVGGGEADLREDWTYGDGMWRSTDGGDTWQHIGLEDAQQIARIVVDQHDPDRLFVAAMGHASGPNSTRGVYRSTDGGKHWDRVLFLDDSTGAIDVEQDPSNSRILFAAMWRMEREPWGFISGAARSGLWKSTDGGDTWTEITHNKGMPRSMIGRIGVSISPANPRRIYANIEAPPEDSTGGIFRSDDGGNSWMRVNGDQKWMVRPWYYNIVTADPQDENTVYAMNLSTWKSIDGGRTWSRMRVPHGDDHVLWVDPHDNTRMISGNDGGAAISLDGGQTWSSQGTTEPTGQFYHVATDDAWPYRIYGAQQDDGSIWIASRSDEGAIGIRDWDAIGGGEASYIAPKPGNPDILITSGYTGSVTRYRVSTKQTKDISPELNNYDGWPAGQVPLRFQWTFPIFYSHHDASTVYISANKVLRSTNDGDTWEIISPDLTRHDPKTLGVVGGPVTLDMTGTEWYATIFALAESPVTADVLWAGSDDGLIHVTRDKGKTWTNVTPKDMAPYTRVSIIEPSHSAPGTAYVAANRYQLDDFHPYLWKTTDYGATWTRIDHGIPNGAYTRTIREDPVRAGLLFVGTETGVWFSTDDARTWQPLQLNLPRSSVRDLTIHGSDLIAATHGRAIWAMDDISPLRAIAATMPTTPTLFRPEPVVRFAGGGGFQPQGAGANPVSGAIIDYWIPQGTSGTATIDILDSAGTVIRTFNSAHAHNNRPTFVDRDSTGKLVPREPRDTAAIEPRNSREMMVDDSLSFSPSDSVVMMRAGLNRLVWDLRYPGTDEASDIVNDEGTTAGPMIAPGHYTVRLSLGGKTQTQPLDIVPDPRQKGTPQGYAEQFALALQVQKKTNELVATTKTIESIESQLDARTSEASNTTYATRVSDAAKGIRKKVEAIRDSLLDVHSHADEITLHYPVRYYNMLLSLAGMVQSDEGSITPQEKRIYSDLAKGVDGLIAQLHTIETTDLTSFNSMMREVGAPSVAVPGNTNTPTP